MAYSQSWSDILTSLLDRRDLSVSDASWAMDQVMSGKASDAQLAYFLVALRSKGETVDEIVGFRDAVLDHAVALEVDPRALDIVGTGGDRHGTVNVSTMASIVAASAGISVVKHGNRAASSKAGASDVLTALGVELDISNVRTAEVLGEAGITFAFASKFHPGFANVAGVRRELGVPTVFNYLGPLCNPARPEASAVGVAQLDRVPLFVGVFQTRGPPRSSSEATTASMNSRRQDTVISGRSRAARSSSMISIPETWASRGLTCPNCSEGRRLQRGDRPEGLRRREGCRSRHRFAQRCGLSMASFELSVDPEQARRPIVERLAEKIAAAARSIDSGASAATLSGWVEATTR